MRLSKQRWSSKVSYEYNKRYRYSHPSKRADERKKYYDKYSDSPNSKKLWKEEELQMVLDHKVSDVELHKMLGRSVRAIQAMRTKLKNENVPDYIAEMKLEY